MQATKLRRNILRLAREEPKLRPKLLRLLEAHGGVSDEERDFFHEAFEGSTVIPQGEEEELLMDEEGLLMDENEDVPKSEDEEVPKSETDNRTLIPQPPIIIHQPPIIIQQPPIIIPEAVKPGQESAPVSIIGVPEKTQKGFETELLPELIRLTGQGMKPLVAQVEVLKVLEVAFTQKDTLYNILIQYQTSFEGDAEFKSHLEQLVEAWKPGG